MKSKKVAVVTSRDHKNLEKKGTCNAIIPYCPAGMGSRWYFLVSTERALVRNQEENTLRRYIRKKAKRTRSKYTLRLASHVKLTKKALGVRMGNGKGSKVYSTVMPINRGFIFASLRRFPRVKAKKVQSRFRRKLSMYFRMRFLKINRDLRRYSRLYSVLGISVISYSASGKYNFFESRRFSEIMEDNL